MKIDASQTVKRMKILDPNLAMYQLATWAEIVVKFELKLSNKNGKENHTKPRQEWSRRQNKNDIECGKCK